MKPGDTLETVAEQFAVPLEELFEINRATIGPYTCMERPGIVILIPKGKDESANNEDKLGIT